jgi:2-polyprenyl-6-methoxyphenol hydroxylase-like FAD-dependent oxidoreductase
MSPAGGVGINLAIQDAVAAANLLAGPLREGQVSEELLARVQARREFPTRVTQAMQVQAHRVFTHVFDHPGRLQAPWQVKVLDRLPGIHTVLGCVVGIGVRPEHVAGARRPEPQRRLVAALAVTAGVVAALFVLHWRSR